MLLCACMSECVRVLWTSGAMVLRYIYILEIMLVLVRRRRKQSIRGRRAQSRAYMLFWNFRRRGDAGEDRQSAPNNWAAVERLVSSKELPILPMSSPIRPGNVGGGRGGRKKVLVDISTFPSGNGKDKRMWPELGQPGQYLLGYYWVITGGTC